jgi:hypothetical protein
MKVGICSLVFGQQHSIEFYNMIKNINNNPIYAFTNNPKLEKKDNLHITYSDSNFNFNLKRFAIGEALNKHDTIVCLDTDICFTYDFEFDNIDNIEDGLYVSWKGLVQKYKGNKLSINQIINKKSGISEIDTYGDALIECGATSDNISFFDEFAFILKLSNNRTKNRFLNMWNKIYTQTESKQPTDRHDEQLSGALESLIISLVCSNCNIPIISNHPTTNILFDSIIHYDSIKKENNITLI